MADFRMLEQPQPLCAECGHLLPSYDSYPLEKVVSRGYWLFSHHNLNCPQHSRLFKLPVEVRVLDAI